MDVRHFKQRLQDQERELESQIARLQEATRAATEPEVGDFADQALAESEKFSAAEKLTVLSETLIQVREALARIDNGTYGICIECGRPIEQSRLEAVPWAQYCLQDQEKHDLAAQVHQGGATL